jgi:AcrR family transcriptional regulator
MPEALLTPDRILEAAEDILRRYGPAKATVIDVARVLGVSHGSIYRHFESKSALRDALIERWLSRILDPLTTISLESSPAPERLHHWLTTLIEIKHRRAFDDPEFFATYMALSAEAREVIHAHKESLVVQVTRIITDGCTQREFTVADPAAAARAVVHATSRFHNPVNAIEWKAPEIDMEFEQVWDLLLAGLRAQDRK